MQIVSLSVANVLLTSHYPSDITRIDVWTKGFPLGNGIELIIKQGYFTFNGGKSPNAIEACKTRIINVTKLFVRLEHRI